MEAAAFSGAYKCNNEKCDCHEYMIRGNLVVLKPEYCQSCLYGHFSWVNCNVHFELMWDFLNIDLCFECKLISDFCTKCKSELTCKGMYL